MLYINVKLFHDTYIVSGVICMIYQCATTSNFLPVINIIIQDKGF